MSGKYPVIDVTPYKAIDFEQMGSKEKWWLSHPDLGLCLFKKARKDTGEDWSEKAAEQICVLLEMPHARYELAIHGTNRGVLTPTLYSCNPTLISGNEILYKVFDGYPKFNVGEREFRRIPQYTLSRVVSIISNELMLVPFEYVMPKFFGKALPLFVGYLLLDSLIGNNDRHDENWAIIMLREIETNTLFITLSPTYDHASSLGRELTDPERIERLFGRDKRRTVETYAEKARSPFYANENDEKPIGVIEAFFEVARLMPEAARYWAEKLEAIDEVRFEEIFDAFPDGYMSAEAIQFALQIMRFNKKRILEGVGALK